MAEISAADLLGKGVAIDPNAIDMKTGASAAARAAAGAAHRQRDRLATLRKFYPDARPYGSTGQFIFTNPETGLLTLYNERNPEVLGMQVPTIGDIVSAGREITEGVGATAGGMIGARAGPMTGVAGAGLGGAGGDAAYDLFSNLALGTEDTRDIPERVTDLGMAGLTNAAAEGAGGVIGKGLEWLTGATAPAMQRMAAQARQLVQGTPGSISANRGIQGLESVMAQAPITGNTVGGAQQRMIEQTGAAAERAAAAAAGPGRTSGLTEVQGGELAQRGAQAAADRFATIRNSLDDRLVAAVGADTPVPLTNAAEAWQTLTNRLQRAPESLRTSVADARQRLGSAIRDAARGMGRDVDALPADPAQWDEAVLAEVLENGTIPFDVLRSIRTSLGKALERPDASGMLPEGAGAVRQAYDALRGDIQAAATNAGPAAERLLAQHDQYVTAYRGGNNPIMDRLTELTELPTGQAAFDRMWGLATTDGNAFNRIASRLRGGERDQLASAIIGKLGQAKAGAQNAAGDVFSPATYLTNWNKLQPEVKQTLFGSGRNRELRLAMDDLASIMEGIKQSGAARNTSSTAPHLGTYGVAAGLGGAATSALTTGDIKPLAAATLMIGMARGSAEAWASPRFVRWLGQTANALGRSNNAPSVMKNALIRLGAIKELEPGLSDWIEQYQNSLRPILQGQPAEQKEGSE